MITCSSSFCCYCAMAGRTRSRSPQRIRPSPIKVCARDLSGNTLYEDWLDKTSHVDWLHKQIRETHAIDERLQTIYFNGKRWKGTHTAEELGVHPNAEMTLITLERKQPHYYCKLRDCQRCWLPRYCEEYILEHEDQQRFQKLELHYCYECIEEILKLRRNSLDDEDAYVRDVIKYDLGISRYRARDARHEARRDNIRGAA